MDTLVDKIVRGQANIDRMKSEIKTVVNSVVGALRMHHTVELADRYVMVHGDCPGVQWEFSPNDHVGRVMLWEIDTAWCKTLLYSDKQEPLLSDVKKVYDNLEMFVMLMLEQFPYLEQNMMIPLWDAAGPSPAAKGEVQAN